MENLEKRKKIVDRKKFWLSQDKKILSRSDYKCAHCGKKLDLKTKTREHIIPVTKGGTNELKNLVALCEDCNQDKSNYVVDPEDYYIHLDWVYLKDLIKKYGEYSESVNWVSKR